MVVPLPFPLRTIPAHARCQRVRLRSGPCRPRACARTVTLAEGRTRRIVGMERFRCADRRTAGADSRPVCRTPCTIRVPKTRQPQRDFPRPRLALNRISLLSNPSIGGATRWRDGGKPRIAGWKVLIGNRKGMAVTAVKLLLFLLRDHACRRQTGRWVGRHGALRTGTETAVHVNDVTNWLRYAPAALRSDMNALSPIPYSLRSRSVAARRRASSTASR